MDLSVKSKCLPHPLWVYLINITLIWVFNSGFSLLRQFIDMLITYILITIKQNSNCFVWFGQINSPKNKNGCKSSKLCNIWPVMMKVLDIFWVKFSLKGNHLLIKNESGIKFRGVAYISLMTHIYNIEGNLVKGFLYCILQWWMWFSYFIK